MVFCRLVVSLVLLLLYLACSLTSCFHISCASVQITGETYSRSLNSCSTLGKQMCLSPWSENSTSGTFRPNANSKPVGDIKAWSFLVISFRVTVVDEMLDSLCLWLLSYLTAPIYLWPNSFQPFWVIWLLSAKPGASMFLVLITLVNPWLAQKFIKRDLLTRSWRRKVGWWVHAGAWCPQTQRRHVGRMHPSYCYFYGSLYGKSLVLDKSNESMKYWKLPRNWWWIIVGI